MIPSITGFGKVPARKLHYDYFGTYYGKNVANPHSTKYGYNKRNLMQYGINCRSSNYLETLHDFKRFKPKSHTKNKTINIVLGFRNDEINCHQMLGRIEAIQLGIKFVHLAFGYNVQALISLQHDSHEPHLHITINNVNIKTLHAIPAKQRNLSRLEAIDTQMIKGYNRTNPIQPLINPFKHKFQSEIQHSKINERINVSKSTKHSLDYRVRTAFLESLMNPKNSSKTKFRKFMKRNYQIRVKFIRPNKHRNRHHRKRHSHYGIVMIPFVYTDKSHQHTKSMHSIKASGIGIKYHSTIKQLRQNRKLLKQQRLDAKDKRKTKQRIKRNKRKAIIKERKNAERKIKNAYRRVKSASNNVIGYTDIIGGMDYMKFEAKYIGLKKNAINNHLITSNQIKQIEDKPISSKPKVIKKSIPKATKSSAKVSQPKPNPTKHTVPTVDNTMTRLSVPNAQQDFGTELDMRQQEPSNVTKATHEIRHHYQLREQHARIIDEYMNRANRYNSHHHINIFKRAVIKAKSWLHDKHIKFKHWIKKTIKPKQLTKNDENYVGSTKWKREVDKSSIHQPTKSESDDKEKGIIQKRAFNRNRLKRIKGNEWQK